jgi:hypothetical protein
MKQTGGEITETLIRFVELCRALFDSRFQLSLSPSEYFIVSAIHFSRSYDESGREQESKDGNGLGCIRNAE